MILKLEEKIHLLNACSAQALCSMGGQDGVLFATFAAFFSTPTPSRSSQPRCSVEARQHGSTTYIPSCLQRAVLTLESSVCQERVHCKELEGARALLALV